MAIRVRKLAKELKQTSGEVLGMLHHLGFAHYQRPDDMVADPPAAKVRAAAKRGLRAAAVHVNEAPVSQASRTQKASSNDLMAQLVPGVVRADHGAPEPATPNGIRQAAPPKPSPVTPAPIPHGELEAMRKERDALLAQRDQWAAERDAAVQARDEAVAASQAVPQPSEEAPAGVNVGALLQQRGLQGPEESREALCALLSARQADALLSARLSEAGGERLRMDLGAMVLLDGAPPDQLTTVAVAVASDRAEGPGGPTLARAVEPLGEQMLLNGLRRLRLVGVPPRWHGALVARIDRRVFVDFAPGGEWDGPRAAVALADVDVVGAIGITMTAEAEAVVASHRAVVAVEPVGLVALLGALVERLRD